MKVLTVYPNCSRGGVISVIRARALATPSATHHAVFLNERGGLGSFDDLPNVTPRIIRKDRASAYLRYLCQQFVYDEVRIMSLPDIANALSENEELAVTYEFHSSNLDIVRKELQELQLDRIAEIIVPSLEMHEAITPLLTKRLRKRLRVEPNLLDNVSFNRSQPAGFFPSLRHEKGKSNIPLVWVGRLDKGKGADYVPRMLAKLPLQYHAHLVLSLENDPERMGRFLYECDAMGVRSRIHLYMNLSPAELGDLYRSAATLGGRYISTSLMESFGYAVREALECGLAVSAFRIPVFEALETEDTNILLTPIGDIQGMANSILK